jgi:hypothetical protein
MCTSLINSVSEVTMDWMTKGMRIQFLVGGSFYSSKPDRQALLPTQLPAQRAQGYRLRTKRCRHVGDYSPLYRTVFNFPTYHTEYTVVT